MKRIIASGSDIVAALERAGFERSTRKGSHQKMTNPKTGRPTIVPLHREVAQGTLRSVLRQAAMTDDDLLHWLGR